MTYWFINAATSECGSIRELANLGNAVINAREGEFQLFDNLQDYFQELERESAFRTNQAFDTEKALNRLPKYNLVQWVRLLLQYKKLNAIISNLDNEIIQVRRQISMQRKLDSMLQ